LKKLKLKKFTVGPVESGLAIVAIFVAGVIGYQFADIRDKSQDTLANADQEAQVGQESEIVAKEAEKPANEVKVPAEEKPEEIKPTEQVAEKPAPTTEVKQEEQKPQTVKVSLSGSATQAGDTVSASATLGESLTGTCHIKFTKTINQEMKKVYKTVTISNANKCSTTFSADKDFGTTGKWDYGVWFVSDDKTREGWFGTSININ